jgi:ketosteroid isomerase-like protein
MAIEASDLTSAIRALDAEFIKHANTGDAAALTRGFYADDAVLLPPNGPIARGTAAGLLAFRGAQNGSGGRSTVVR